jgi:hypothetical protein
MEDILLVFVLPKPKDNVKGLYWELKNQHDAPLRLKLFSVVFPAYKS